MTDQDSGGDQHAATHDHDEHHGASLKTYLAVFFALCVLTMCSFLTYFDIWRSHFSAHTGWAFMMAVSCTKAMLVILFFMHLKYEANWKYVLTVPAAFMSMFLILMLVPDVGMRGVRASEERRHYMAEQAVPSSESSHSAAEDGAEH